MNKKNLSRVNRVDFKINDQYNVRIMIVLSVVIIYLISMLFIGWWAGRKVHNLSDFMVAGRRLSLPLAIATMFATWFGACSSMGTAGTVYKEGLLGVISDPFGASLALVIAGLFYAGAFRHLKLFTVVDLFGQRYSKGAEIMAALLMVPVYLGWLGSQIVAIGFVFKTFTPIDANTGMIIGTIVTLAYTYAGGMWAVSLTDLPQMVILIAGMLTVLPFSLHGAGGFDAIIAGTPKEFFSLIPLINSTSEWTTYLGKWLIMGLGCVVGQDLIQRSLSSRTEGIARWSAIWAGIIYFIMGLVIILIALAGRIILPNLDNPESLIPTLAIKYLGGIHPLLMAVFISGLLGAIMSSADSSLIAAVSLFNNNVIRRVFPHTSEHKLLAYSRWGTVLATLAAMFIALYVGQVYNLMVNSWAMLLVAIFVPATVALFWPKRASLEACWVSMIAGSLIWAGLIVYGTGNFDITDSNMGVYYSASFYGFIASLAGYLLTTVFLKPLRIMLKRTFI